MSMPTPACTVYFDGACPLCRREIAHYRSQKGAASMAWVDIATSDDASLGADLSRADALTRLHVRQADGALVSGAAAFAAIWNHLPAYGWLARIASRRPVMKAMDLAYSWFLRLRPLWRGAEKPAATPPAANSSAARPTRRGAPARPWVAGGSTPGTGAWPGSRRPDGASRKAANHDHRHD